MAGSRQYACTNCFNWFQFEDLAEDSQLCKECLNNKNNSDASLNGHVKNKKKAIEGGKSRCKFCRTEAQNQSKTKSHICERCVKNKAEYGEPRSCSFCHLHAAFIGSKCRRCASSMKKYGPPQICSQCKLKAAFNHPKALDKNNLLCWLCTSTAQKAMKKVKRRASEEAMSQGIKKTKMWTVSAESESSPTEIVIEEEVMIHEKDISDQTSWDEYSSQDMDYRLPVESIKSETKSEDNKNNLQLTSNSATKSNNHDKCRTLSSHKEKSHKSNKSKKLTTKTEEKFTTSDTLPADLIAKVKKNRLKVKEARRSAPAAMNVTKHKHERRSRHGLHKKETNNIKQSDTAANMLDAKIMHLQKKLSHKRDINEKSIEMAESTPTIIIDVDKNDDSNLDKTSRSLTSLPMLKTSDGTSKLERFRTTDSGSSSPLPTVNDGNIVIVTQLRAEISSLKKQVSQKDKELLEKDKQISCIKVGHLQEQRDLRAKMKDLISKHSETLEQLQTKNQDLLKKVSQLSKGRA
uniref:protein FAM76B-like n=1 Tax=Styela clava TaxID=7725 RepID=UPI001939FC4C|nr:protein FAM76B-like [Styela clava]